MPRDTKTYDIVLSCPTDVEIEKAVIESVINDFNRTIGTNLDINLNLKHWSTDSYAQSGGAAQELLNKQFIYESDMIICIFWGRMGTPTEKYESGTAEELQEAIIAGKQVFLYFSNAPIPPKELDSEQYARVQEFEKKIREMKTVYYKQYDNLEDFKSVITTDLNLYFIQSQKSGKDSLALTTKHNSNVVVSGIQNKKIVNYLVSERVTSIFSNAIETKKKEAIALIERIQDIYIKPEITEQDNEPIDMDKQAAMFSLFKKYGKQPYEYPDYYVTTIDNFSKNQGIDLNDTFFEVGSLSIENNFAYIPTFGGMANDSFKGSEIEKKKQDLVEQLYFEICEYLDWIDYSSQFSNISLIRLALSNRGTIFESDITINLKFSKSSYTHFKDTKAPNESIIKWINDNDFIKNFFGDINSVEVNSYSYPIYHSIASSFQPPILPGFSNPAKYEDLVEDYFNQQEILQCYEEFEDGEYIIQKYHFEELKQYTSISFPVPLLFKETEDDLEIHFEIISRENPLKKEGLITNTLC